MSIRSSWFITCLMLAVALVAFTCSPCFSQTAGGLDATKDPRLQGKVSIEIGGRPLSVVLERLSESLPVELRINDPAIREQRVTLFFSDVPAWKIMEAIVAVLSHGSQGRPQYRWTNGNPGSGKPILLLLPQREAFLAAEAERQRPWQEIRADLTLYRDIAMGRAAYSAAESSPSRFVRMLKPGVTNDLTQTLRSLSDIQFATLLQGDPVLFTRTYEGSPSQALYIQLRENKRLPGALSDFIFQSWRADLLRGGGGLVINRGTYSPRLPNDSSSGLLPVPQDKSLKDTPIYDLSEELKRAGFDEKAKKDSVTCLMLLAKLAHVSVVEEHFIKRRFDSDKFVTGSETTSLRGTLPELFNRFCLINGYRVYFERGTYHLWSDNWAWDRLSDIPEKALNRWIAYGEEVQAKGKTFVGTDFLAIAADLRLPQFAVTLCTIVPLADAGPVGGTGYNAARVISLLSDSERQVARSEAGLPVRLASAKARQVILTELDVPGYYRFIAPLPMRPVNENLILESTIHLPTYGNEYNPDFKPWIEAESMKLIAPDGSTLWQKGDYE